MFSNRILATDKEKTTLNWWEYWIGHCWMTGWQSIRMTFRIWADLMTSNYDGYALLKEDDPEGECLDWFWASLNEDDVYPKEFLEHLMQLADDVATGKEEVIPLDEDFFDRLKDLVKDVDLDDDLNSI
jgi:hypothetical protein